MYSVVHLTMAHFGFTESFEKFNMITIYKNEVVVETEAATASDDMQGINPGAVIVEHDTNTSGTPNRLSPACYGRTTRSEFSNENHHNRDNEFDFRNVAESRVQTSVQNGGVHVTNATSSSPIGTKIVHYTKAEKGSNVIMSTDIQAVVPETCIINTGKKSAVLEKRLESGSSTTNSQHAVKDESAIVSDGLKEKNVVLCIQSNMTENGNTKICDRQTHTKESAASLESESECVVTFDVQMTVQSNANITSTLPVENLQASFRASQAVLQNGQTTDRKTSNGISYKNNNTDMPVKVKNSTPGSNIVIGQKPQTKSETSTISKRGQAIPTVSVESQATSNCSQAIIKIGGTIESNPQQRVTNKNTRHVHHEMSASSSGNGNSNQQYTPLTPNILPRSYSLERSNVTTPNGSTQNASRFTPTATSHVQSMLSKIKNSKLAHCMKWQFISMSILLCSFIPDRFFAMLENPYCPEPSCSSSLHMPIIITSLA